MGFSGLPNVHWLESGELQLDAPLTYTANSGTIFTVPEGFTTDLASVPSIVPGVIRVLFRGPLQTAMAAILHDYLYETGLVSRKTADDLFYEALRATGEGRIGAFLMWSGVRAGGWFVWRRHGHAR